MTTWRIVDPLDLVDEDGDPIAEPRGGYLQLLNDRGEHLGSVIWFCDDGPWYGWAVDWSESQFLKRLGSFTSFEGCKNCVEAVASGEHPSADEGALIAAR